MTNGVSYRQSRYNDILLREIALRELLFLYSNDFYVNFRTSLKVYMLPIRTMLYSIPRFESKCFARMKIRKGEEFYLLKSDRLLDT